jgi:hypothetical protein
MLSVQLDPNCHPFLFSARVMSLVNKTDPDWVALGKDAGSASLELAYKKSPSFVSYLAL